jgi:hypothetical protein
MFAGCYSMSRRSFRLNLPPTLLSSAQTPSSQLRNLISQLHRRAARAYFIQYTQQPQKLDGTSWV